MLDQWEDAVMHGNHDTPNEVHIAGDMNLDSLRGRWLESDYSLVSLSRMVQDCCNSNNFTQLVDKVTRIQYNSIQRKTVSSCIDHVYCNAKHRISEVNILTCGTSDHDAIAYTRFLKEPKPPAKTIRKRSYKNFKKKIIWEMWQELTLLMFTAVQKWMMQQLCLQLSWLMSWMHMHHG